MFFPATACLVQDKIGANRAWGFDLSAACSGFLYGLTVGAQFVESGAHQKVMVIGADVMNPALALTQVPGQLAELVGGWGLPPVAVVGAILLFYVVLGAVMDELSMILLTIPIFFPLVMALDFGMSKEYTAIWFGIMVLMTVGFGLLAPPVGLNVYIVNGLARDVPIWESYRGVMPFLLTDTVRTVLLLFFPAISLWVVRYIG